MRRIQAGLITGFLALAWASCAKTTEHEGIGTNTNWLQTCKAQDDCDDGESCVCGVCTIDCQNSDECSALHEATQCEPVQRGLCGGQSASTSACLQGCSDSGDCTAVENGRCVSGLCVPGPPLTAECTIHSDCYNSPISREQGRCGPEVACIDGVCDAWCPGDACETTDQAVNACSEAGWICADALAPGFMFGVCRATDIWCDSVDQCPKYRPSNEGEWTCEGGYCRFPGFLYLYQNPPTDRFALTRDGGDIVISDAYTRCDNDDDCELVSAGCDGCCQHGAVNRELVATYEAHVAPACAGYQGAICNCINEDLVAGCVEGVCQSRPRQVAGMSFD